MYNPQIETLIQVADAGSFSKAAERMYITPVSVMNQVNALEKRIGVKLFERTNPRGRADRGGALHLPGCQTDHRRL